MGFPPGTRLGPYEILAPAGTGGMGEVYRARDTRLDRTVAIKVLPESFSGSAEFKQRFEREAKAISSLNHPHICTLHDVGSQNGTDYLVMEYLEGQTLAERLEKGPLPLDQVLKVGAQIADALEKAHRQGIIHRDLKPGNIMLSKSGAKLMDFGLAKPVMALSASATSPLTPATPTIDLSSLTSPISPLTQKGSIVGTFQYMAPEVLQGAEADARSDIFSLGCVLYEMATGRRPFEGKSQLSVMSAILEKDPEPVRAIAPNLPPVLDRVIEACLAKDPAQRLQSAHDAAMQLSWIGGKEEVGSETKTPATLSSRSGWIAAAAVLVIGLIAAYLIARSWPQTTSLQASIEIPENVTEELVGDESGPPTLSPDGTMLLIRAHSKGESSTLWIRHLDSGQWQQLEGTQQANFPFWSPDSKQVAFFTMDGKLNRVRLGGGSVSQISAVQVGRGGTWGKDDTILFTPDFQAGLFRVSADGGTPTPVTTLNRSVATTHRWPQFMPDGKHFIYFAANHNGSRRQQDGIYFGSLDGKASRLVMASDASAIYASGCLIFRAAGALQARRFDPSSGEFKGEPVTLSNDVQYDPSTWHLSVTASESGLMVFARGSGETAGGRLEWMDRSGKAEPLSNVAPADFQSLRLSPDGRRIAAEIRSTVDDIWIIDPERGAPTRLTFGNNDNFSPVWSPDGKRIAYGQGANTGITAVQGFGMSLHIMNADGSGKDEEVLPGDLSTSINLLDWTSDGKYLVYRRGTGPLDAGIWALPLFGDHKPFPVVSPPSGAVDIAQGQVSYDGKWLAYTSNETGRLEVYITSFPVASGKFPVSSGGGLRPSWRRDGKELFFVNPSTMLVAVNVKIEPDRVEVGSQRTLFPISDSRHAVDIRSDGQKLIVAASPRGESKPMTLLTNWTALLNKK